MESVVVTTRDKFKPRKVSAVRVFPMGCGPLAGLANGKPSVDTIPPSAQPEVSLSSKSETPGADDAAGPPPKKDSLDRRESLGTSSEPMELAESSESVRPEVVEPSKVPNQKEIGGSSVGTLVPNTNGDPVIKLEATELPEESPDPSKLPDVSKVEEDVAGCTSKIYGPPKRRKVSAVRHFPPGCGRNAIPRERASFRDKSLVGESMSTGEQKPSAEDTDRVAVVKKLEGNLERTGAKQVQVQAGVQEVNGQVQLDLVPKSNLNGSTTEEYIEKKVLARVASGSLLGHEGVQEIGVEVGTKSVSKDIFDDITMQERSEKKVIVKEASGSSGERDQEIDGEDSVTSVSKSNLQGGNTMEERNEKRVPARVALRNKVEGGNTKQVTRKLQIREAHGSKSSHTGAKPQTGRKPVETEDRISVAKSVESKHAEDFRTPKRKFPEELEDEDGATNHLYQRGESMSLDAIADRLIVQGLMAEPNCPWRQGKRPGVGSHHSAMSGEKAKKRANMSNKRLASLGSAATRHRNKAAEEDEEDLLPQDEESEYALVVHKESRELSVTVTPFGPFSSNHKGSDTEEGATRNKVRKILRLFQVICRKLLQGEEAKSKEPGRSNRIDLKAAAILREYNECVNTDKILGNVPGVEVGDEFHYRVELAIVGLHRPYQAGIDFMKYGNMMLAISIVASGGYDDDLDNSDVLIYSGSGGNPSDGDKQAEDQKLERGNLALKNSIEAETPVRVIRGIKEVKGSDSHDARAKQVSTFTYNGLYLVEKYWKERVPKGFFVFKFQLRRMPGQPELAVKEVKRSTKSAVREGLCVKDISEGKECIPICAVNTIDDDRPMPFKYTTSVVYPSWYDPTPPRGCDCPDGCSDSEKCVCAVKNGGEIPFNFNGSIVQAKPLVYECGPSCKCPPSCHNRVSQHGIKIQLEVFKTASMGWGVRSLNSIPSGSFICEYTGELLQDKEAEQRSNDEYLFDIGHNYDDHSLWDGLPTLIPGLQSSSQCEVVEDVGFTIDAAEYGNVGRFINHSCSPNLYAQNVLYDHDDKRMPHIMLFAADNIPPLQELTYHYNYTIDQVRDSEGNIKRKICYCGSHECTGRLY